MVQRICKHPGCTRPHDWRGYCRTHNSRIRTHGDPYGKRCEDCRRPLDEVFAVVRSQRFCPDCHPLCSIDGCDGPVRKLTWCATHYAQAQQIGAPKPIKRPWAPAGGDCRVCGRPAGLETRSRKYCSQACAALGRRYGDLRPTIKRCALCACEIDMLAIRGGGRRPMSTKLCDDCKRRRKFGVTTTFLAQRDGTDCTICGDPVDMTLRRQDSVFCPSIDHRVPRACGGSDDPDNLALAHFWCNAVKSDREAFTI